MAEATRLADPLGDAREVLEAFRSCDVVVPEWAQRLRAAASALDGLPAVDVDIRHRQLAGQLRTLADGDLASERVAVARAADDVARLLQEVHIEGLPRPEDDYWGFD